MQVIVDGLLTNYEKTGKGRPVLLLHGWGDSSKGLQGLQQALGNKYQVIALDLPGFGGSQAPKEAWDLDNYAGFVQHFLQKIAAPEVYAVIGHSNGGALAIRAMALGKLKPQKLVLMAASGVRIKPPARRILLMTLAKVGNVATLWLPERYRRNLRESLYGAIGSDALVVESMRPTFQKVVRQDVQADAAKVDVPALLVYAANDTATPVEYGRIYQRVMPQAELKIIPAASHFVHLDEPEVVAGAIEDFLK